MAITTVTTSRTYLSTTSVPASKTIKGSPFTLAIRAYCVTSGSSVLDTGGDIGTYIAIAGSTLVGSAFANWASIGNSSSVGSVYLDMSHASTAEEIFVEYGATSNNTWVHWAATYDGSGAASGVKIYKNGALVTPVSSGGTLTTADAWDRILVGGQDGDTQDAWCFNRVLTAAEIGLLYASRFPRVDRTSLVGHWPLINGDNAVDWSGNGRNLTATASPTNATRQGPVPWGGRGPTIIIPASTATNITGTSSTASSATAAVSFNQQFPINATASTASSATAAVSLSQVFSITATATTKSSAAATNTVSIQQTATGTTASSASAAIQVGINATGTTASSATAAVSVSTTTAITGASTTASSAAATVGLTQQIAAAGSTASSATAAVSFAQVIPITAAGQTASSAAASFGSVSFQLTAAATTRSNAQGAIGSLLMASATTASTGAASFTSASFPLAATGTTGSFASATMTSSGGGGGGSGTEGAQTGSLRRWLGALGARRRTRK